MSTNVEDLAGLIAMSAGTVVGLRRICRVLEEGGGSALLGSSPASLRRLADELATQVDKVSPALIRTIEEFSP